MLVTIDQARRLKSLARWHRRIALVVCVWVGVLAASGLLINHAHDWGLDRSPLAASMQRLLYGIERDGEDFCGRAATLGPDCAAVFAGLSTPAGELLLGATELFLIDERGRLVEQLAAAQLGLGDLEAGLIEGSDLYLRDARQVVRTDAELLDWQVLDSAAAAALEGRDWQVRGGGGATISWERFLLDLHAARFLGPLAKTFTDLMGGLILLLALSGLWLWWLKRPRD
jgi:hypothetical protein